MTVLGAITLNPAVGGLNAARRRDRGARGRANRLVPTVNAANEQHEVHRRRPGAQGAGLGRVRARAARARASTPEPVPVVDDGGALLPEARDGARGGRPPRPGARAPGTSRATRSSRSSTRAREAGVRDVVVTHPEFPSQSLSIADQVELARAGSAARALLHDAAHREGRPGSVCSGDRARSGAEHTVWSSDLGQVVQPAGRGRARADGRPFLDGRLHRGRGRHDGRHQHAPARRGAA